MGNTIKLTDVPDDLLERLKARAAQEGLPLATYLLVEIKKIAEQPTMAEIRERLASLEPVNPPESAADIIRESRNSR